MIQSYNNMPHTAQDRNRKMKDVMNSKPDTYLLTYWNNDVECMLVKGSKKSEFEIAAVIDENYSVFVVFYLSMWDDEDDGVESQLKAKRIVVVQVENIIFQNLSRWILFGPFFSFSFPIK